MESSNNVSGSSPPSSAEDMDTTNLAPTQVGQITDDCDKELACAASTSLTLEEEVEKAVEEVMMEVSSGGSETGSSQRTEGNLGPMATPVPAPPVFGSNDIRVKQGKVQPDTNVRVGGTNLAPAKVIWSPAPPGSRTRSVSSRRERPKHQTPGTDSPPSAAKVQPIERLGRPRAKNPRSTRSTSSGPLTAVTKSLSVGVRLQLFLGSTVNEL